LSHHGGRAGVPGLRVARMTVVPIRTRGWLGHLSDAISDYGQSSYADGVERRAMSGHTRAAHERITEQLECGLRDIALLEAHIEQLRKRAA